jgi:methionyl-tRNA formyltransferase
MMGTGTFAVPVFEALLAQKRHPVLGLVTQPDRAVGQERGSTRQVGRSMKQIALDHGLPVFQPESINTPAGIDGLREMAPDLLVVAAYGQILSREVLSIPRHGGINVHGSLLPRYRGAAPVAWAIYHGETRTGVTIIHMSPRMDAGDMLAQKQVDILADETAGELEARLAQVGASLVVPVIDQIDAGNARPIPQDSSQATRAPKLKKEDGLIDWTRTAEQVCCQVRAMQPWPTAFTFLHRSGNRPERVLVLRAAVLPVPEIVGHVIAPGAICGHDLKDARLVVWAGGMTQVEILELQPAGRRRMSAADFLRGHPLQPGDRFGPENA